MTRDDFLSELRTSNIDPNIVNFDTSNKDGYCLRKNYNRWETFVKERGKEYDILGFPSESDALQNLLQEILSIYKI